MSTDPTTSPIEAPVEALAEAPRTRWAAIIWGALFAAVAIAGIRLLSDERSVGAVADWAMTLTPTTLGALGLLAVGVLVLVSGAVGLVRHLQRRFATRQR